MSRLWPLFRLLVKSLDSFATGISLMSFIRFTLRNIIFPRSILPLFYILLSTSLFFVICCCQNFCDICSCYILRLNAWKICTTSIISVLLYVSLRFDFVLTYICFSLLWYALILIFLTLFILVSDVKFFLFSSSWNFSQSCAFSHL